MKASTTACLLSAGVMLATAVPAFAQQGSGRAVRDRPAQRAVAHRHVHHPGARHYVPYRHAYYYGRPFAYGYGWGPYAYYAGPRFYYGPPVVAYGPPLYYYTEPPYYIAQAPAPQASPPPPPRAQKPAPAPKRFSLSADALFDFDQAVLKPEGRRQLDKLAADLKGTEYDLVKVTMVTVTGHTDRLGAPAYNQQLSVRRAETVKGYLVNLGIPASKIVASGKGETSPVTKPGECRGEKPTRELIACLQPDRRVEVEVSIAK